MTEANTYSWIFFAVAAASQQGAAKVSEITPIADAINHAIPTQKEMKNSIDWLQTQSLIIREGKRIGTTAEGRELFSMVNSKPGGAMKTWDRITSEFKKMGADDQTQMEC